MKSNTDIGHTWTNVVLIGIDPRSEREWTEVGFVSYS
jgi:hypothetical protein